MILLVGCSSLLGIEDPSPRGDGGVPPDVPTTSKDRLAFSLTDVKLAQTQIVRLHVLLVHEDSSMLDVTASAMYLSDNTAIAAIGGPGVIHGGAQAGSATITASLGMANPATMKATVTTATCHPVINELSPGSAASATAEWVEIYNPCKDPVDVSTWTLVYRGASTTGSDTSTLMSLTGSMNSGEIRLYAGSGYTGANDGQWGTGLGLGANDGAVGLRAGPKDTGSLVDSVAYGNVISSHLFMEVSSTLPLPNGKSAARLPFDGNDSNNNGADFVIVTAETPHALNVP
jgi:hypothetical protein